MNTRWLLPVTLYDVGFYIRVRLSHRPITCCPFHLTLNRDFAAGSKRCGPPSEWRQDQGTSADHQPRSYSCQTRMTSPAPSHDSWRDVSLFEETKISAMVTADDAPQFFQQHGVFYQAVPGMEETKKRLGNAAQSITGLDMFNITDTVNSQELFLWTVAYSVLYAASPKNPRALHSHSLVCLRPNPRIFPILHHSRED